MRQHILLPTCKFIFLLLPLAMNALKEESSKFAFKVQGDLTSEYVKVMTQCRATTFLVHQVRHLSRVRGASEDNKNDVTAASVTSMQQHSAAYSDLSGALTCPQFDKLVKDEIL